MADKNYIPKYSYQDYILWEGDWELIYGNPIAKSPSPKKKHAMLGVALISAFQESLKNAKTNSGCNCQLLYEVDWKVNEQTVVRPDISIICNENSEDYIVNPPQLIVEILSASTQLIDRNTKFSLYESCGVKFYILADPELKELEVYELIDNNYKTVKPASLQLTNSCILTLEFDAILKGLTD